jgi:hypothetical protein
MNREGAGAGIASVADVGLPVHYADRDNDGGDDDKGTN